MSLSTNSVLSMKDMLCQLCGQVYKEPRMLSCLHNYCTDCLVEYVQQTTKEGVVICPQCRIETQLVGSVHDGLPVNTFVKRNINEYGLLNTAPAQTETDAENKELTEMSHYTSTEAKEEMETCQQRGVRDSQSRVDDEETYMGSGEGWTSSSYNSTVDSLHEKYLQLQTKALQITYAVDMVNKSVDDWKENRCRVKEDIQHRSQCLQSLIRQLERKLIAEMENSKHVDEFMQEVTETKAKLQDSLRLTLHNIQFIRQLINDGQRDDIICLGKPVLKMKPSELNHEINLRLPEYKLEFMDGKESHLANEFGELDKAWREKNIMTSSVGKVDVPQKKTILSDEPIDMTRSMIAEPNEVHQIKHHHKVRMPPSPSSFKRNSTRRKTLDGKHLTVLSDTEKNIYLKYEEAKKNLEKRRRELAVKHMVGNKSRSQDESTPAQNEDNVPEKSSRGTNRNLSLNRAIENRLEKVEEIHAGSEGNILALNDNWRRSRYDCYREETGQVHSECSSPIIAAKVTMARKKVTAILGQQQLMNRSSSLSPQTSETFFGGTSNPSTGSSDRSPTTPEKIFMTDRWQEATVREKKMQEDRENEGDILVIREDNEHFKPMSRDKFNQVKENVRRKNDRWRSVSVTN